MLKHGSFTLSISSSMNSHLSGGFTCFGGSSPLPGDGYIGLFISFGSVGLTSGFISKIDGDFGLRGSFGFFNLLGDLFLKVSFTVPLGSGSCSSGLRFIK